MLRDLKSNLCSVSTRSAIAIAMCFIAQPAFAASSEWQDLGGGKARLLAILDPQTNKVSGAIEVKLEPGWTTYWRYPGSSGIPPNFDFSPSISFKTGEVKFPAPKLLSQGNNPYAGYKKNVTFPFEGELTSTTTGKIDLNLLIGVCAEICIPAQASLKITTDQLLRSDPVANQVISFAKLAVPKPGYAEDKIPSVSQPNRDTLEITVNHKQNHGEPSLFVEGPEQWYLTPAKLVSQSETQAVFQLDVSRAPATADPMKQKLRYTLVSGGQGYEIDR